MRNVLYIIKRDLQNIRGNKAMYIMIIALAVLPSLYAWINVYASWDPYANTGDIPIAIVSEDKGAELDGLTINVGDEVVSSLSKNEELGWKFVTRKKAIRGVEHGDYYAAIVIPKNFSKKMLSVTTDQIEKPEIDYYINEKVNAISPKVTEKGATSIVENIQKNFVKETNKAILNVLNDLGYELDQNYESIQKVKEVVFDLEEKMPKITEKTYKAKEDLDEAENAVERVNKSLIKAEQAYEKANELNNEISSTIDQTETTVNQTVSKITKHLNDAQKLFAKVPEKTKKVYEKEDEIDQFIDTLDEQKTKLNKATDYISETEKRLKETEEQLQNSTKVEDLQTNLQNQTKHLHELKEDLNSMIEKIDNNNSLTEATEKDEAQKEAIEKINELIEQIENDIDRIDSFNDNLSEVSEIIADGFIPNSKEIENMKKHLQKAEDKADDIIDYIKKGKEQGKVHLENIESLAQEVNTTIERILTFIENDFTNRLDDAFKKANLALNKTSNVLNTLDEKLPTIKNILQQVNNKIEEGRNLLQIVEKHLPKAEKTVKSIAEQIRKLEEKGSLNDLIDILSKDPTRISDFFANPITLNEQSLYEIPNYGSAMNPFYTTLSLWVGALLLISAFKVDVNDKHRFKSYEVYIGRIVFFLTMGILQSLIVSLGNVFILEAYIVNKLLFILFSLFISVVFVTIVYTFVSILGNTGKVISIILMVMQLGGSGGTFPIQMAPKFFQHISNALPFTHAINLLREAVGGTIWTIALKEISFLLIYVIIALLIGLFTKKFFNRSSDQFMKKAQKSDMVI